MAASRFPFTVAGKDLSAWGAEVAIRGNRTSGAYSAKYGGGSNRHMLADWAVAIEDEVLRRFPIPPEEGVLAEACHLYNEANGIDCNHDGELWDCRDQAGQLRQFFRQVSDAAAAKWKQEQA